MYTLLYYIGGIYRGEGKGGVLRKGGKGDAEGRGIYREREEKGHFGEEKGMFRGRERGVSGKGKGRFGEENRGGNWNRERDKLKSRRRIEGRWTGIERKLSRDQTGIKRKSNKNGTESCVNIVNAIGETFISEMERTKLLLLKDLFFEDKRLVLTVR